MPQSGSRELASTPRRARYWHYQPICTGRCRPRAAAAPREHQDDQPPDLFRLWGQPPFDYGFRLPTDVVSPLIHRAKLRGEAAVIRCLIFGPSRRPRWTSRSRSAGVRAPVWAASSVGCGSRSSGTRTCGPALPGGTAQNDQQGMEESGHADIRLRAWSTSPRYSAGSVSAGE